jgi:hypothetical protein
MEFRNKKILLISPSKWGDIFISKHHYSVALAKLGNEIYYLEPAESKNPKKIAINTPISDLLNLKVITIYMPYWMELLRFKQRWLYDIFNKLFIKSFLKKMHIKFDIVWSFETNLYSNLKEFEVDFSIYHPVDIGVYEFQKKIAKTAEICFSVSESLVSDFKIYNINTFFINHGLSDDFVKIAQQNLVKADQLSTTNTIKVGFVGNLFRTELNRNFISYVVTNHPEIEFHIWGPTSHNQSNVDGLLNDETLSFIKLLGKEKKVFLHGVKFGKELAVDLEKCDLLLLALNISMMYDGSNSHKIMEYLSTGKTIVSHFVSTYVDMGLIEMSNDAQTHNLINVFESSLLRISILNSKYNQLNRIEFALNNSYIKQIERIESLINDKLFTN